MQRHHQDVRLRGRPEWAQLLEDLLEYETAAERYSYLKKEFLDVSSAKKQDELVSKRENLPILSGPRP